MLRKKLNHDDTQMPPSCEPERLVPCYRMTRIHDLLQCMIDISSIACPSFQVSRPQQSRPSCDEIVLLTTARSSGRSSGCVPSYTSNTLTPVRGTLCREDLFQEWTRHVVSQFRPPFCRTLSKLNQGATSKGTSWCSWGFPRRCESWRQWSLFDRRDVHW